MKNPASYIQKTLGDLLDGNITYNATAVPVFSNDQEHPDRLQIVIGEYSDADASNKRNFQGIVSQVIEVASVQRTGAKKTVNDVGELIMDLLQPSVGSQQLSGTDFQVFLRGKPSINHLVEPSGSGQKIVRLILRYNINVIDNNI